MKFRLLAIALLSISSVAFAGSTMYQWKEKGVTYFSDVPPKGDVEFSQRNRPLDSWTGTEKTESVDKKADESKPDTARDSAREEKEAAERAENCSTAKSAKATLKSGKKISVVDDKGNLVYLDDAAIAKKLEAAEKAIESWCTAEKKQ